MNKYFEVGDIRFDSREKATERIASWKANVPRFSVCEVANAEVTRKTAKGYIMTEQVRGSLDQVPRIISVRKLDPTYVVINGLADENTLRYSCYTHFPALADAEKERTKRQSEADRLAALTEADIKEVHVPTLADVLERDEDKIDALQEEMVKAGENLQHLEKLGQEAVADAIAKLEQQIAAVKDLAAQRFGVPQAKEQYDAAVDAFNAAIHYDKLEKEALRKMQKEHNCWPDSDCRVAGECTYEPDPDEIEEYLFQNAEDFEVEVV